MHVMPISIFFDNCKRLSVTQGEALSLQVKLYDEQMRQPVDLTNYSVTFAVPGSNGQTIKRSTVPVSVDLTKAKQGDGETIFSAANGFVTGDIVAIPLDANNVTTPLKPGGRYTVTVIDQGSFTLIDISDTDNPVPVLLDAKVGSVQFASNFDIVAGSEALLGMFTMSLGENVTAAMAAMQGQDYQLTLTGGGMTRIYTGRGQLDVFAQSAP